MVASLGQLLDLMRHHGATRIYAKRLAPNDNSKNQVYLGGDFSALNIIPHGNIYTGDAEVAGAVRNRAKAAVVVPMKDRRLGRRRFFIGLKLSSNG